ncbi:MAG: hypothetical protein VZS44_07695 [Bacilli bacterium]|nr:hypothetical protein [Bacilli bacterium]
MADERTKTTMEQGMYSLLLAGLFALLFRLALDPAYKEEKKKYKD